MKSLMDYMNEELDDNMFYLLDVWFSANDNDKQEFMSLISDCMKNGTSTDFISKQLQNHYKGLYNTLSQFVSFINNNMISDTSVDYIYQLKNILDTIIGNKSPQNMYVVR